MHRPGVTLLELVLFIAIMGIVIMFLVPFMVFSSENQVRQQTVSLVRQAGENVLQTIGRTLRTAERIHYPAMAGSGEILMLQNAIAANDPTVFGLSGSILMSFQRGEETALNPPSVFVRNLSVANTSVSATHQSLYISFEVGRYYPLSRSGSYIRKFEGNFTLFPSDSPVGNSCGCAANLFTCNPLDTAKWAACDAGACSVFYQKKLLCTP